MYSLIHLDFAQICISWLWACDAVPRAMEQLGFKPTYLEQNDVVVLNSSCSRAKIWCVTAGSHFYPPGLMFRATNSRSRSWSQPVPPWPDFRDIWGGGEQQAAGTPPGGVLQGSPGDWSGSGCWCIVHFDWPSRQLDVSRARLSGTGRARACFMAGSAKRGTGAGNPSEPLHLVPRPAYSANKLVSP